MLNLDRISAPSNRAVNQPDVPKSAASCVSMAAANCTIVGPPVSLSLGLFCNIGVDGVVIALDLVVVLELVVVLVCAPLWHCGARERKNVCVRDQFQLVIAPVVKM
jgi:F0F1-type ATP synthase membrane subunit a